MIESSCSFYSVLPVGAKQAFLACEDFRKSEISAILPSSLTVSDGGWCMKFFCSFFLVLFCFAAVPEKAISQAAAAPAVSPSPVIAQPTAQTTEYTLPPDKLAKSKALYDLRGKLRIVGAVYGLL